MRKGRVCCKWGWEEKEGFIDRVLRLLVFVESEESLKCFKYSFNMFICIFFMFIVVVVELGVMFWKLLGSFVGI